MVLSRVGLLALVALFLLSCGVFADTVVATSTDTLTGHNAIQTITCNATVTQGLDNIYTYTYELLYTSGTATVHTYKVENPNQATFFDAANVPGAGSTSFVDPDDGDSYWLQWGYGDLTPNSSCVFSYKSAYAPMVDVKGWQVVINGGSSAVGKTLVMGDTIPEPASIAVVLMGVAGMVPVALRRRSRS